MNVYCPGCGTPFTAEPSPADPARTVTCPKCKTRFPTAGIAAKPGPTEPKRKFKAKKKGGPWPAIGLVVLALALLGGVGYWAYAMGWFKTSKSDGPVTQGSTGDSWQEVNSVEGKFRILLPGAPVRIPRTTKEVELRADTPHLQASVVFADLPEKTKPEKYMVAPPGAKVINEKEITLGGHTGRDIVADIPGRGVVHMRYLFAGQRLYTVLIVGKTQPASASDVSRLFDSFQVTG